jgi:hypothetical protein
VGRFLTADLYTNLPNDERILFKSLDLDNKVLTKGLENPQGQNRYTYCLNNPLNRIDPDGRNPIAIKAMDLVISLAIVWIAVAYENFVAPALENIGKAIDKAIADTRSTIGGGISVGDRTSGGRTMTGHAAQQANRRGFTLDRIDKIIDNNKASRKSKVDEQGRKTWEYTDNRGNKVVTNEKGDIVTVYGPAKNENGEYERQVRRQSRTMIIIRVIQTNHERYEYNA